MKYISICLILLCFVFVLTVSASEYPDYNMKWSFNIFNDPDARQVAVNIAQNQEGLIEREDDVIAAFVEALERRLYSTTQSKIVDIILENDDIPYGEFEAGDLIISIAEDPNTNEILVETTDKITGESTILVYSSFDYNVDFDF